MTARETYIEKMKLELDELNDQLSSLEAKAARATQNAREHCEIGLVKLRRHSQNALAKWDDLKTSSEGSWHRWMSDMDRMRDAFVHSIREFKSRL